jgi:hypothetical protein
LLPFGMRADSVSCQASTIAILEGGVRVGMGASNVLSSGSASCTWQPQGDTCCLGPEDGNKCPTAPETGHLPCSKP